jgi:hypothetical protein
VATVNRAFPEGLAPARLLGHSDPNLIHLDRAINRLTTVGKGDNITKAIFLYNSLE